LFSGGTTGIPKAVEHTHRRLAFSVRSMAKIFGPRTEGDVFLAIAPFSHMYGLLAGVLLPVYVRGETVIPERFQPEHIVELIMRHRVTIFGGGPPAIYTAVLAANNLHGADLSSLRICPAGRCTVPGRTHGPLAARDGT
jgi:long-chain acyl-CoA synthetase